MRAGQEPDARGPETAAWRGAASSGMVGVGWLVVVVVEGGVGGGGCCGVGLGRRCQMVVDCELPVYKLLVGDECDKLRTSTPRKDNHQPAVFPSHFLLGSVLSFCSFLVRMQVSYRVYNAFANLLQCGNRDTEWKVKVLVEASLLETNAISRESC